LLLFRRSYRKW